LTPVAAAAAAAEQVAERPGRGADQRWADDGRCERVSGPHWTPGRDTRPALERRAARPRPARPIGRSARPAPCTGARSAPANGTAAMPEVGGGGRAGAVRRDARRYARLSGRLVLPPTMLGFTTTDSSAADTAVCLLSNLSTQQLQPQGASITSPKT